MPICRLCGDVITIRYVSGGSRPVPIHESGRCGGALPVNDYSGRRQIHEDLCYGRECPECGESVFFIRHNGGCCWIDPPLGPPWYKHSCFDSGTSAVGNIRGSLYDVYRLKDEKLSEAHNLCVVSFTEVSSAKQITRIGACTSKGGGFEILVTGNGGYLIGKLCIYNSLLAVIYPIGEPDYRYNVVTVTEISMDELGKCGATIKCTQCEEHVSFNDFGRHMDLHYYDSWFEKHKK